MASFVDSGFSLPPLRRALSVLLLAFAVVLPSASAVARPASTPADDIVLIEGATYRARLKLSFLECLASRDRIRKKFRRGGFDSVHIYMSARELPPDWPAPFRSRAGGCERYAQGTWSRPTTPHARPSSIDSWWVSHPA